MKKKFGKLTIKEVQQLCENHNGCIDCPIYEMCPRRFDTPEDWKEDLEDEVEL